MMRTAKPLIAAIAATLTLWSGGATLADDTEIFQATPTNGAAAKPNILLIIDTSGSMVDNNVVQPAEYDPLLSYSGPCRSSRIYYTKGSGTVSCEGTGENRYITSSQLVCKTAKDRIEGTGVTGSALGTYVAANTVQWKGGSTKQWVTLDTSLSGSENVVECVADAAIRHGAADNDGLLPRNGNSSPWTSDPTKAANLTGVSATYTFSKGNYLNYLAEKGASGGTVTLTRLEVVKSTARRFLDSIDNVNVGLMRFESRASRDGQAQGGYVIHEFAPIETARDALKKAITDLDGISFTPLAETMYEAFLYWKGAAPYYGNDSNSMSIPASRVSAGGNYKSPLGSTCGSNFNVLLTDGDPTGDLDADLEIARLPGMKSAVLPPAVPAANVCSEDGGDGSASGQDKGDGRCLNDIAKYMFDNDLFDDPAITPPTFEPKNNVKTYTIGFGDGMSTQGKALLQSTADVGQGAKPGEGKYYEASDGVALDAAFQDITRDVVDTNVSFSAPTVAVNAFNRTQNLNDLYMTVFAPSDQFHWAGNLKKYRLKADGTIMDSTAAPDGPKPAVNPATGFFAKNTRSYWSTVDDGPDVKLGGAANKLPNPLQDATTNKRNVYTDVGVATSNSLFNAANLVTYKATGATITRALTGLPDTATEAELEAHIKWIRGADSDDDDGDGNRDEQRFEMGDPLHARPVSVIYRGTSTAPIGVIYTATNDGFLHAIDATTGEELWSYIPSEVMPRMAELRENASVAAKTYGLDGNIRAFKLDRDGDGLVEPAATNGDRVLLFFGMGRGGDTYFALDVTDETQPKLLWKHSGSTGDNVLIGLGESWSTPIVTRVNVNGATQNADKLVIIFGGGYDNSQDNVGFHADSLGNHLYIVDAISGTVLWHAGPTSGLGGYDSGAEFKHAKMTNSFPADLRVIDISGDGLADRIYAADTGARVWRFDIINGSDAANLVRGGVLASLGMDVTSGATSPADARKFYVAPDASLVTTTAGTTFVNLAIGSGMRGSPKNTQVVDRLYALRDYNPFTQLTAAQYTTMSGAPITDASLVDVTTTVAPTIGATATGWKIRLTSTGEKSLAEARTFQGAVLFTTYDPEANQAVNSSGCSSTSGKSGLWVMKVLDAAPYIDRDQDTTLEVQDRRADLNQEGLAPEAVIIFPSPDNPDTCQGTACSPPPVCLVGLENCGVSFADAPIKTFWSQRDVD
jgi:type IV pilus assembly protein PilY1